MSTIVDRTCYYFFWISLSKALSSFRKGIKVVKLRRGSAAASLLRLWAAWPFVMRVVCCQVEVSATS
jgi:hypothetical protein